MGLNLNFSSLETTKAVSTSSHLRAWNIYENVKFEGISDPITGTNSMGGEWKAYDFTFSCPEGSYSERIFEPTEKSIERRSFPNSNGHDVEMPSDWERTKLFVTHVIAVYNPKGFETLQQNANKLKTFDQFIALAKKLLENTEITTNLKLAGRNTGGTVYASLPKFAYVAKDGDAKIRENFLGDKVTFTAWELQQKEAFEKVKPTDMPTVDSADNIVDPEPANDEDINSLIAGL